MGSTYSFVVQVKFLFLIQKHSYPGSGQDRAHFLQKPGGAVARTQSLFYTTSRHCWGQGSGAFTGLCVASTRLWAIHLFRAHSKYCCCHCPFSYFTVVSSRFFFYQPPTFTFCASNSLLQPPAEERGEGSEWVEHNLECFSENSELGNTIPKPWQ